MVEASIYTHCIISLESVLRKAIKVEHVPGNEQKAEILTKALARIKYREMRELIRVHDVKKKYFKFRGETVGISLKEA